MRGSNSEGFSLVEVLVALVIFMLGILGVMGMQYMAVRGNSTSRELRIGTNLAQHVLEQARGMDYADLASGVVPLAATDTTATGGVAFTQAVWVVPDCRDLILSGAAGGDDLTCDDDDQNGVLDGNLVASCVAGADLDDAAAIRSRVCWLDRDGVNHSVTLDTLRWGR